MNVGKFLRGISVISWLCFASACTTEHYYRQVPAATWQQMNSQQKQLVVDQAYFHSALSEQR